MVIKRTAALIVHPHNCFSQCQRWWFRPIATDRSDHMHSSSMGWRYSQLVWNVMLATFRESNWLFQSHGLLLSHTWIYKRFHPALYLCLMKYWKETEKHYLFYISRLCCKRNAIKRSKCSISPWFFVVVVQLVIFYILLNPCHIFHTYYLHITYVIVIPPPSYLYLEFHFRIQLHGPLLSCCLYLFSCGEETAAPNATYTKLHSLGID